MTAISITCYPEETLTEPEEASGVRSAYCGRGLTFFRKLRGDRFCTDEHRKHWHVERLARALETE